jgi:hypothetical protein
MEPPFRPGAAATTAPDRGERADRRFARSMNGLHPTISIFRWIACRNDGRLRALIEA